MFPEVVMPLTPTPCVMLLEPDSADSWMGLMTAIIDVPAYEAPVWRVRRLVWAGLIAAFVLAAVVALWPYEISKECKGGAFSPGFGPAFDAQRCDVVFKFGGAGRELRARLPDVLQLCCPSKKACGGGMLSLGAEC